ncbi:hypothetical protein Y1Q_0010040 [Alligator mississippiensis]|uniref:Uncharacterized protein n=1 Tax=Alligator mississippiensis TaxID=8496 RepID=A0A151NMN3_ALLMI|nr:hypothetical protein Y1Q_0010040 [Alligator mississippiensis]
MEQAAAAGGVGDDNVWDQQQHKIEQTVTVTAPLAPEQVRAAAMNLGPLNKETAIQWVAECLDQTGWTIPDCQAVAQANCNSGDWSVIKAALDNGQTVEDNLYGWTRRILTALSGAWIVSRLYFWEVQKPGESPEAYIQRKQLLGCASGLIPHLGNGDYNFDDLGLKTTLIEGLTASIKVILGPVDDAIQWPELRTRI